MDSDTPLLAEEADDFNSQMEALRSRESVKFSVDLEGAARQLLGLLREVDIQGTFYAGVTVERAVERYERYWLPLLAKVQHGATWQQLVPPLDVEWVWLCHRLAPAMYEEDCESLFRKTIDSALQDPLSFNRESGRATCRHVWNTIYPTEPYDLPANCFTVSPGDLNSVDGSKTVENSNTFSGSPNSSSGDSSFDCSIDSNSDSSSSDESAGSDNGSVDNSVVSLTDSVEQKPRFLSQFGYDLIAAVKRQSEFFYQVDRPCMAHAEYMKGSLQRYRLFLNLIKMHRGAFLVPTYDIDLLWHAHMMLPVAYKNDTFELFGRILNHDDTEDDRSEGKKLELEYKSTSFTWNKEYGLPYDRAGAMYRGENPNLASPPPPPPSPPSDPITLSLPLSGNRKWKNTLQEIIPSKASDFPTLTARMVFKVHIMIWGVYNLPNFIDQPLFVRIRPMKAAPQIELDTNGKPYSKGWPLPSWKHRWVLECEQSSKGIKLELMAEPKSWLGQLWGSRILGSSNLEWAEVQGKPGFFIDTQLPLSGFSLLGDSKKVPNLHVAVSTTPMEQGPYLLRTLFMRGTDDCGNMICEDYVFLNGFKPQVGRWVSRTVLDHQDKEVYVARKRVATGVWDDALRPKPVLPRERVIVVHEGGWKYLESAYNRDIFDETDVEPPHCRVGSADGPIVAQAVPQKTNDSAAEQEYAIVIGSERHCRFKVTRDVMVTKWIDTISMEMHDEGGHPARLLLGRHLQYFVQGSSHTEEQGFVTLIRYTPLYPTGIATGLFNWRNSTLECAKDENPLLLLLLSLSFTEALHEMEEINRAKPYRRVRIAPYDPTTHWDAFVGPKHLYSKQDGDLKFGNFERESVRWWNVGSERGRSVGAGGCGAGACGPSSIEGSPGEIYVQRGTRKAVKHS